MYNVKKLQLIKFVLVRVIDQMEHNFHTIKLRLATLNATCLFREMS